MRASLLFLLIACRLAPAIPGKCDRFVVAFSGLIQEASYSWDSQELTRAPVTDEDRAVQIMLDVAYGGGPIASEVEAYLKRLPTDEVHKIRMDIGDLFNLFDPGYQQTMTSADGALAAAKRIAEMGCGSGMVCAYLAFDAPERRVVAVDNRESVFPALERRIARVPEPRGRVMPYQGDFAEIELPPESLDGAVVGMTLFHLKRKGKEALLDKLRHALKKGAPLVVNDPTLQGPVPPGHVFERRARVMVEQGVALTEFQYALWAAVHGGIFLERLGRDYEHAAEPLTTYELETLIQGSGFDVREVEALWAYGYSRVIATRR